MRDVQNCVFLGVAVAQMLAGPGVSDFDRAVYALRCARYSVRRRSYGPMMRRFRAVSTAIVSVAESHAVRSFGVGVYHDVKPARPLLRRQRGDGNHVQRVIAYRSADRIRGGVDRDLELLVPELGLVVLNEIVQLVGPVVHLHTLLPKLQ